jgi:tRNA-splicing ligase RtcB
MIHSGSRNFGLKTANEYHNKARALVQKWGSSIPTDELSFLPMDTKEGNEYFGAMKYCVRFALANRALMMDNVKKTINKVLGTEGIEYTNEINIEHNYASIENHFGKNVLVHRKGATRANIGLLGIIPGSMGTFSYIVEGLGNPESFRSCSHGAGRRMGRKQAIKNLNLEEEQNKMKGILGAPRNQDDLDEAPGAYKPIGEVMENQKDLTKILVELCPLAVIKG